MENKLLKINKFLTPLTIATVTIYLFSGACSLTYEIIWQRLLKLILGNTTYATSITIAVFMGGLAFGAFLVRKKADAIKNKLFVYGCIELLVTLFALLTPFFLKKIDIAYIFLFQSYAPSPSVILTLQIIVSMIILAVPTILIGTTLPILSSLVVRNAAFTGWETGVLYAVNTLGALIGVSATGFVFIRQLGVYPAYFIAVGLNAGIAIVSIIVSRLYHTDNKQVELVQHTFNSTFPQKRGIRAAVLSWLFIMGFVALGYEIVWIRSVVLLLKAEIYTFSSVLCVYLLGYTVGLFAGGKLAKATRQFELFTVIAPIVGLCGILYLPMLTSVLDNRFLWNLKLLNKLLSVFAYLPHLYMCILFFFLPSFLMGVCFPLLVQMQRNLSNSTGDTVSKAYSVNTVGCVLGSIGTGFFLIPFLGAETSMQILGLLAAISGLSALFFVQKRSMWVIGSVIPATCLIIVLLQPKDIFPKWINKCEGKGTYKVTLLDFREGKTTTASVLQYADSSKVISTAGINVAGDALPLRQTQKFQGHFPVIMHGNVKSVLTVGFGSGELTKTLTFHGIPDITCVEISPEMVALSKRHFSHINLGNNLEKYIHMVYMDAKNYMHLTNKKYDCIENDCIWPGTFAESSSLYTKEYFTDAKRCLNEDGIFSTWLTLDLPKTTLLSIIKTFGSVFENTLFIYPHYAPDRHILLMGQKSGHPFDYLKAKREFEKEKVRESLSLIGIKGVDELLGCIVADYSSLRTTADSAATNSDYFPFVEFDMNRVQLIGDKLITWKNLGFIVRNTERVDYNRLFSFSGLSDSERTTVLNTLTKNQNVNEYLLESFCIHSSDERIQLVNKGLTIDPENQELLNIRKQMVGW
jgi:spermidine synthase